MEINKNMTGKFPGGHSRIYVAGRSASTYRYTGIQVCIHILYKFMIFLDKTFIVKDVVVTVPKKEVRICLPFLGKQSFEIRMKLCKFVSLHFSQCKLQVIF